MTLEGFFFVIDGVALPFDCQTKSLSSGTRVPAVTKSEVQILYFDPSGLKIKRRQYINYF